MKMTAEIVARVAALICTLGAVFFYTSGDIPRATFWLLATGLNWIVAEDVRA